MLTVGKGNFNNIILRGDFWDFDRLYFAISKFTGDFGIDSTCPFPGYETICESLLGLCYELRKAQEGKRELYKQYNGIPEEWFEEKTEIDEKSNDMNDSDHTFDDVEDDDEVDEDMNLIPTFQEKVFRILQLLTPYCNFRFLFQKPSTMH